MLFLLGRLLFLVPSHPVPYQLQFIFQIKYYCLRETSLNLMAGSPVISSSYYPVLLLQS